LILRSVPKQTTNSDKFDFTEHRTLNSTKYKMASIEELTKEIKKISEQRDRLLRKNKRQATEIEKLQADKKKFFDEVVEATQCDADTEDEVVSIITDMESEYDPEMMREIKEKYEDEKLKVAYYDGFLTKMFDEDQNGEWTEWTDFVEKKSFEDGKRLFGFEGDSDEDSDEE
tara:strand:+ start:1841 stop:2356 length:516 start_codon:yes stop_codon:yes gene_type:complete